MGQAGGAGSPPQASLAVTGDSSVVPIDLRTALELTLSQNPEVVSVRNNLPVSAEAVRAARRLPESLNPTVSADVAPWVFEPVPGDGSNRLKTRVSVSLTQPIELGHRSSHRTSMAEAAFCQTRWQIVQVELASLVQTYRAHQTAVYRRGKLEVINGLAHFDERLRATLRRQLDADQISAADVVLAEVEGQATRQQLEAARQEYAAALADLRQQIGISRIAASAEPVGELSVPAGSEMENLDTLIGTALNCRPEIQSARSQVANSRAAVALARAERIPVPAIGPAYENDETGISYYGVAVSTPVPVWNAGGALLRQREAEYRRDVVVLEQHQERTTAQVKAAWTKWQQAKGTAAQALSLTEPMKAQAARMERLFEAGQADVVKLLQVRRRSIEARSAQLDCVWQSTQAYADLLAAVGTASLMGRPAADADGVQGEGARK